MRVIVGIFFLVFCGWAQAEWIKYAETENGPVYYDPKRILSISAEKVSVWKKFRIDNKALAEGILIDPSFKNYAFTVSKNIHDCKAQQFTVSAIHYYDNDGKAFLSIVFAPQEIEFHDVIPGSVAALLAAIVCKKKAAAS
jgi:hypothetical protein